ncbi:hypothetical protein [Streptomyces sp. NPDC047014]|uniref:hypothetical protein n=1 Tax=Streptomyces sp. NPDC047014 TaxID=3155736 RepID=UPI0033D1FAE3
MSLLTEFKVLAIPDYRLVEIRDSDASLSDAKMVETAKVRVVASGGSQICIHSLQRDIDVQVTIRIWDSPQEPPHGVEGYTQVALESPTGVIGVDALITGDACMSLPFPGSYEGHAAWINRQATADYVDECIARAAEEEWTAVRIGQAHKECPVLEQYCLDLWHTREPDAKTA